jgi:alkyl sulfatase BDS1-like metallo-beta-lactamase superfamily hydrolase
LALDRIIPWAFERLIFPRRQNVVLELFLNQPAAHPAASATAFTRIAQERFATQMPKEDGLDFEEARAGFVATWPEPAIRDSEGRVVWDWSAYEFLKDASAPDTANPSLWRQARLNMIHGLFKVCDRIYQIRGFDIANMTVIEGDTGLIIIDPLTTVDVARAALKLYFDHRPKKPIHCLIYTHSHADHFGGVKAVISQDDVDLGRIKVIAPAGFLEEAVSENVIAGPAMLRRAAYQFGPLLAPGPTGQIDAGLGKVTARGMVTLIAPTQLIVENVERHLIDGIECVFQLTPQTEAPAEMHLYFPQFKALNMAENVTHLMHNLLPIRGAQARNALAWSKAIDHALEHYGVEAELIFAQHHWPKFGQTRVQAVLSKQRDLYRFMHDQAIRLMNQGATALEIAESIKLPESLSNEFHLRGYYGALVHNLKAVYQRYLGWYDGNPANLHALPPEPYAKKLVEYMGGAEQALVRLQKDFEDGQYRWVAQMANHLVFADASNQAARQLCAAAFEQLAFQAEASTWRNAYLQGAKELREGAPQTPVRAVASGDIVRAMSVDMIFDTLAIRLIPEKAVGKHLKVNWHFSDTGEKYAMNLENCALSYQDRCQREHADASLVLKRSVLNQVLMKKMSFAEAIKNGDLAIVGDPGKLLELMSTLDTTSTMFAIVEP